MAKCKSCGDSIQRKSNKHCCSRFCYVRWSKGENAAHWKGGKTIQRGYRFIRLSEKNRRIQEHILIAEKALGRKLPPHAEIHHFNGIKHDNRNGNLVICNNRAYHGLLESRTRVYLAGGRPGKHKICSHCKMVLPIDVFARKQQAPDGRHCYCRQCHAVRSRTGNPRGRPRKVAIQHANM